jgi:hypothetical protein
MFLNRFRNLNALMRTGLLFLIAASLWRWFVHPGAFLPEDLRDGILGLFYGISITCLLLSVIRRRDRSSCSQP